MAVWPLGDEDGQVVIGLLNLSTVDWTGTAPRTAADRAPPSLAKGYPGAEVGVCCRQ